MQQEHNRKRIYLMKQMLFAMAQGNFNMRIHLSGHDDELEALVELMNMTFAQFKEFVFHLGYINPHRSYAYVVQAMATLNREGNIQLFTNEFRNLIGYPDQELWEQPLTEFLTPESSTLFKRKLIALSPPGESQKNLHLEIISKKGLYLSLPCTLVKFKNSTQIVLSFILPIIQELQASKYIEENLIKQRINRQTDAAIIQKIYDHIRKNFKEPLPPLKILVKKFNTNEFKLKSGFRQFFNTSVYRFYNDERLKRAHIMISQRDLSLKEIAQLTGFSTYSNFYKSFKKKYGYTPTDLLRKRINKDTPNG